MALEQRRQPLIWRSWIQAVAIVMIFGFTVMGFWSRPVYAQRYRRRMGFDHL